MKPMTANRLEAFSDGVLAIVLTIMVLELKAPHGATLVELWPLLPGFLSYVLSFLYVSIYWNNHHHMMHTVAHVTGGMLWANAHLLFWLTLIPFATMWMGENHFAAIPTALYGVILLMAATAYTILQRVIVRAHGTNSPLQRAVGRDAKGKLSILCYAIAIVFSLYMPWIAQLLYVAVAFFWLVPDRRIERLADN